MQSVKKFLFETSFDAQDGRSAASARAGKPVPVYTEDDLEAVRDAARAEGKAEGARDAQASIEAIAAQALARIGDRLADGHAALNAAVDGVKRDAVQVALIVTRKALPGLARESELREVEALVTDCLETVLDEPRVVIRVPDSLLDALKGRVDTLAARSGFTGRIVLLGDANMPQSDCRVEWADGGGERDSSRLWTEIEGTVDRFLATLGPAPSIPAGPHQPANAETVASPAADGGAATRATAAADREARSPAAGADADVPRSPADATPETAEPTAAGEAAKTE
jgi:flagellar assembly protein FliH